MICFFKPSLSGEFPTGSSNRDPKIKELSNLTREKSELISEIKDHDETLELIKKAQQLDKALPEPAKKNNRYVKELEQDYPTFFDEDSGNTSTKEGLNGVTEYVNSEKNSLKSKLSEVNDHMKNIRSEISEQKEETDISSKRNISDSDTDVELSSKKIARTDDNTSNSSNPSQSDAGSFWDFIDL